MFKCCSCKRSLKDRSSSEGDESPSESSSSSSSSSSSDSSSESQQDETKGEQQQQENEQRRDARGQMVVSNQLIFKNDSIILEKHVDDSLATTTVEISDKIAIFQTDKTVVEEKPVNGTVSPVIDKIDGPIGEEASSPAVTEKSPSPIAADSSKFLVSNESDDPDLHKTESSCSDEKKSSSGVFGEVVVVVVVAAAAAAAAGDSPVDDKLSGLAEDEASSPVGETVEESAEWEVVECTDESAKRLEADSAAGWEMVEHADDEVGEEEAIDERGRLSSEEMDDEPSAELSRGEGEERSIDLAPSDEAIDEPTNETPSKPEEDDLEQKLIQELMEKEDMDTSDESEQKSIIEMTRDGKLDSKPISPEGDSEKDSRCADLQAERSPEKSTSPDDLDDRFPTPPPSIAMEASFRGLPTQDTVISSKDEESYETERSSSSSESTRIEQQVGKVESRKTSPSGSIEEEEEEEEEEEVCLEESVGAASDPEARKEETCGSSTVAQKPCVGIRKQEAAGGIGYKESLTSVSSEKDVNGFLNGIGETLVHAGTLKNNIYDASAYIVRTVEDGPEDEGDDSVFESVPHEIADSLPEIIQVIKKPPPPVPAIPRWLSEEDEEGPNGVGGMQEPPATPVARDELALRRHRFVSDLLHAARTSTEHRVRFDPLGPMVHAGCEASEREEHLDELVSRLENITRRLEKVTPAQTQETAVQTNTPSPKRSHFRVNHKEEPPYIEPSPISSPEFALADPIDAMSVAGYEDIVAGPVRDYLQLSQKIGGDVAAHGKLVEKAFQIQFEFIQRAASRPAPTSQTDQMSLLSPTSALIQQIQEFREKNRGSTFINHLSAISESIPALGWVAVSPTPAPYIKEMNDVGQFYTNRILKDWKEKDKTHVEWCKAWVQTLTQLQQYVRQHHTTGLVWAKSGSAPVGIPPPPPPAMMPPIGDVASLGSTNDDRSALFAQINQGENITKNLKRVTSEMQTHKNPSLRTGPAPFKAPVVNNALGKSISPANAPIDKPPVFTRDGKKWLVEYHKGNKDLVIDNVEMNNVVYMFRCQESTLIVKGKINSIVMDSCRKSSVVFDSVVASIEFVNCQSVQMQVLGKVPTISIDKTDGCQVYLSPESLDVELITSKSSEMNIMVPKGNGDYTECPVPEQFKTTISKDSSNRLRTIAVDSLG
ncbi:microtubule-associated protein futsch-like isoform X1 [Prorops nasuta]|uniref:microtubule-associated protein futsch-like isoform X1 n=1 Tax=Prorops nasuta TaxID=863751 RepID=UPI0034CF5F65